MTIKFVKPDGAVLDYKNDYADWLSTGDTVASSSWLVPAGITKDADAFDDTSTLIVLSGGTLGVTYEIINTITTADGLTDERCFDIEIVDCDKRC